ncbi:hypothetical protein FLK61_37455 [Paenalkalicoccus suaedae]|uniref:Cysteine-rich CPCC domain-containing protein n=1 Tax=Paenalkalicoccus suaedae TaxID=2592382 RepID=A0A859FG31_9BACI|nr:hypothetical protein FLK61_37455 [Paenalkalicoccus suaedae]
MFICNVCGFDKLEWPQYLEDDEPNFVICDCCGFQSGYDDLDQGLTFDEYLDKWIKRGAIWVDESKKPKKWSLEKQLKNIKK